MGVQRSTGNLELIAGSIYVDATRRSSRAAPATSRSYASAVPAMTGLVAAARRLLGDGLGGGGAHFGRGGRGTVDLP